MQKFLVRSVSLVLLLSAAESWALPPCPGSYNRYTWTNCYGARTYASGEKYVGEWKDGKGHGQGTYEHAGLKYVGEWKDGKIHGQGAITYSDGGKYVGEFKKLQRHGQGTYTYADGSKYVGEYKEGKEHGQGTYTYAGGSKYVGEYKDGKEHGQGTYTSAYGDKYVGEYKDGKEHGQGTVTLADGRVEEGIYENGEFLYAKKVTPRKGPTVITDAGEAIAAASGTGFAVTHSGHIITNHHVINGCTEPLRLYRRLQILSGLEHEQIKTIFPGDTGAGCSDGLRT